MPLPGGGTTRIKRCQSLSSNPTSRSISIQRAMVHFGGMGSPNIYFQIGEFPPKSSSCEKCSMKMRRQRVFQIVIPPQLAHDLGN